MQRIFINATSFLQLYSATLANYYIIIEIESQLICRFVIFITR